MRTYLTGLLTGLLFATVLLASFNKENTANASYPVIPVVKTPLYSDEDVDWLAKAIYFEARGESLAGQLAVGLVIANRINDHRYPGNVRGVVTQSKRDHNGNVVLNRCQFSWYCDGKPDVPKQDEYWERSKKAAQAILDGSVYDFTDGATHFHNNKVKPNWGFPQVAKIDDHVFYKRP
jgi:spore germination cell wall hydrolase CwlJ-like protein